MGRGKKGAHIPRSFGATSLQPILSKPRVSILLRQGLSVSRTPASQGQIQQRPRSASAGLASAPS